MGHNKRLVKNSLFLYFRMLFSMAISLYTSRVVINVLGIEDYGVYNIVGGVVAIFTFLSSTMSSATSRFITYELELGDKNKIKRVFSSTVTAHYLISLIVVILCETVGLWLLNDKLVLPKDQFVIIHILFQLSIMSVVVSIIRTPYISAIMAYERMDVFAYFEITNTILKLLIVYLLLVVQYNKLLVYGFLVLLLSIVISLLYYIYCRKNFDICKYKFEINKETLLPIITYSSWDLYGNMSVMTRTQGVNVLLNIFFGPIANAATGTVEESCPTLLCGFVFI